MNRKPEASELQSCLADAHSEGGAFSQSTFERAWFQTSYFFLFKKNLEVTNLQFAELAALIRAYTRLVSNRYTPSIQFSTTAAFLTQTAELLEAVRDPQDVALSCKRFANNYAGLYGRVVLLDAYFGSAVVRLPPGLEIPLHLICAHAGYVHSCGPLVFLDQVKQASPEGFYRAISSHLDTVEGGHTFFSPYSHEDFTQHDRSQASELRKGLDDVKLFVGKYWMGDRRLATVLNELGELEAGRMFVADPGQYKAARKKAQESIPDLDSHRTMWLLIDHSITEAGRGEPQYICYDQHYFNASQFQLFDENKPGWHSHTTLPHSLTAAMLNLTVPHLPADGARLIDPFSGTGTTVLEALRFEQLECDAQDLDPICPTLLRDNWDFFALEGADLNHMADQLDGLRESISSTDPAVAAAAAAGLDDRWREAGEHKYDLALRLSEATVGTATYSSAVKQFAAAGEVDRFLTYIALRAIRRHAGERERGYDDAQLSPAFAGEALTLARQIRRLGALKLARDVEGSDEPLIRLSIGDYSLQCSISEAAFASRDAMVDRVLVKDARELEAETYDAIVTDPPYGFNVEHGTEELAEMLAQVLPSLLASLRDGGQLVVALPEKSFVGREPGAFARAEVVAKQVRHFADERDWEIVWPGTLPDLPTRFRERFYWESDRALRRTVLHLRLRRQTSGPDTGAFTALANPER